MHANQLQTIEIEVRECLNNEAALPHRLLLQPTRQFPDKLELLRLFKLNS